MISSGFSLDSLDSLDKIAVIMSDISEKLGMNSKIQKKKSWSVICTPSPCPVLVYHFKLSKHAF